MFKLRLNTVRIRLFIICFILVAIAGQNIATDRSKNHKNAHLQLPVDDKSGQSKTKKNDFEVVKTGARKTVEALLDELAYNLKVENGTLLQPTAANANSLLSQSSPQKTSTVDGHNQLQTTTEPFIHLGNYSVKELTNKVK